MQRNKLQPFFKTRTIYVVRQNLSKQLTIWERIGLLAWTKHFQTKLLSTVTSLPYLLERWQREELDEHCFWMWLISYTSEARKKLAAEKQPRRKTILGLPVSEGHIKANLLSGVKSAGLWHISTHGQLANSPGTAAASPAPTSPCTHGADTGHRCPHLSAAPQTDHAGCTATALQWEHRLQPYICKVYKKLDSMLKEEENL